VDAGGGGDAELRHRHPGRGELQLWVVGEVPDDGDGGVVGHDRSTSFRMLRRRGCTGTACGRRYRAEVDRPPGPGPAGACRGSGIDGRTTGGTSSAVGGGRQLVGRGLGNGGRGGGGWDGGGGAQPAGGGPEAAGGGRGRA